MSWCSSSFESFLKKIASDRILNRRFVGDGFPEEQYRFGNYIFPDKRELVHHDPEFNKLYHSFRREVPDYEEVKWKGKSRFEYARPQMDSWMFHANGTLVGTQVKFNVKACEYRHDLMGGYDMDMTLGEIDEEEVKNIQVMLDYFRNNIEILEASKGMFRFQTFCKIRNLIGMEQYAAILIRENHPRPESVISVKFVTRDKKNYFRGESHGE